MASMGFRRSDKSDNQQTESSVSGGNVNGKMKLIELRGRQFSRLRRQSIEVTIHRSQAEHFAAIHPESKDSPAVGILKLKNTIVECLDSSSFQVREIDYDNPTAMTFVLDSPEDLEYWMLAFSSGSGATSTYKSDLSDILEADDEDED